MTLDNKLGITNSALLAQEEERITKLKARALFDSGMLHTLTPGTFATLAKIHHYLFEDLYDFAGKLRTVNIAKGHFRFASALYLNAAVREIEQMPQATFDEIIAKYVEMNVAHPFREGNGRSMRIWLDHMLASALGQMIDWSRVDKNDYLLAMERSPIKSTELHALLAAALTDQTDNRTLYMKGIDQSYAYEGYDIYRTEEL